MATRRYFQKLTLNTAPLAEDFGDESPIAGVAYSAANAARLYGAGEIVRAKKREVIIVGEGWRVQDDPDHPRRQALRGTGLDWLDGRVFDPDADALSDDAIQEIAERHYRVQELGGATVMAAPGHASPVADGTSRELDLAIAEEFSKLARSPGSLNRETGLRPRLVIEVIVDGRNLASTQIRKLCQLYAAVECDGFIVTGWKFTGTDRQFRLLRELAKRLEIETGLPVITSGLDPLSTAAIANGIAGAIGGWGGHVGPAQHLPETNEGEGDSEHKMGVPVNFAEILGGVRNGPQGEDVRKTLLRRSACGCGHHAQADQPQAQIDTHRHNRFVSELLASTVSAGNPKKATAQLRRMVAHASSVRAELNLPGLHSGWGAACERDTWGLVNPRVRSEDIFWGVGG